MKSNEIIKMKSNEIIKMKSNEIIKMKSCCGADKYVDPANELCE